MTFVTDPNSTPASVATIAYQYDSQRRVTRITEPEGNAIQFVYDARGNISQTTQVAKPGSGLADIVTSAAYPATCANVVTCNQPITTTDPRGAVTDYVWNAQHGGPVSVTEPAPTTGAARPQTRYTYGARNAWYKNSDGNIVQDPRAITLPLTVSTCVTGTSCANAATEIRSTVVYGTAGIANNLQPTATTTAAGNGTPSATVTVAYDHNGDVRTVDGPLTGSGDLTRYRYDAARQVVGMVGPDPDGAGALRNRAMRMTYNPDGSVALSEVGTTVGQGDPAWTAFTSLQQTATTYDAYIRPTLSRFTAAGTTYAVSQVSYDASGRTDCVVQRMNPAAFATPPPSACTPSIVAGSGPDRIARTTYDALSRPVTVTSGVGSVDALVEQATYTPNGLPETLTDGQGNVSTMIYDGFDRLAQMRYPNAAGGGSSTTDYEAYGYDPASNVISTRTRANQTFGAVYDALNRPTAITAPTGTDSVAYVYDNLGRPLSATIPGGVSTTMTWDALSRQTSETGPLGTMAMQYDPAGRRTRLTWPDGFYVGYVHDLTDALTLITQGAGQTGLAAYGYDDLGRRASVVRGNGVVTTYAYDPASRLTAMAHDLAGTAADQVYGYSYNPAGQIIGLSAANDTYGYGALASGTDVYGIDGLNRIAAVNGGALAYDANANLTSDGTRTFAYDAANRLRGTGSSSLDYDALGRLRRMVGTQGAQYIYDGAEIAGIGTSGTTVGNKLVRGPWPDELVVSFAGTAPTYSVQDHLSSTVALTDASGTATFINRYDDYGRPQAGNGSRFQYTGQMWLPDFGVYHYKARQYHPGLGRFLQTDPIGYAAGANLYAYVGNDPVNFTDPLGLCVVGTFDERGAICLEPIGPVPGPTRNPPTGGPGLTIGGNGPGVGVGGGNGGVATDQCQSPSGAINAARRIAGYLQTTADIGVVGSAATGVGVPLAGGLALFSGAVELGLYGLNAYDALVNKNSGPLTAQFAAAPVRFAPGGRAFQGALRALRGRTGILRNSRGQFRASYLKNPGIAAVVQEGAETGTQNVANQVLC